MPPPPDPAGNISKGDTLPWAGLSRVLELRPETPVSFPGLPPASSHFKRRILCVHRFWSSVRRRRQLPPPPACAAQALSTAPPPGPGRNLSVAQFPVCDVGETTAVRVQLHGKCEGLGTKM